MAPQLGGPASSDGSTACWVALRAREESPSRSDCHVGSAVVPPSAHSKAFGIRTLSTPQAQRQLAILEFESRSPQPSVEAELDLGPARGSASAGGATACCAWLDLGCSTYLLAVGLADQVQLYLQRPTREFLPQRAPWCLVREIAMPAATVCSSLVWIGGGSLLLAAGSSLLVWHAVAHEFVAHSSASDGGVGDDTTDRPMLTTPDLAPLDPWHPAQLTHELHAEDPGRSERVLRHLLQHLKREPPAGPVPWLPFGQLVGMPEGGRGPAATVSASTLEGHGGDTAASAADLFAPVDTAAAAADLFAPTDTAAAAADLFAPSPMAPPNFLDLDTPDAQAARPGAATAGLQGAVVELLRWLEQPDRQAGAGTCLGAKDEAWLVSLLRAQQIVGGAANGLDHCGALLATLRIQATPPGNPDGGPAYSAATLCIQARASCSAR